MRANAGKLVTALILSVFAGSALAEVPQLINYQGSLATSAGQPVPDGQYLMTFVIYDDDNAPLWTSGPTMVQVTGGLFKYDLGSGLPFPDSLFTANNTTERHLGVKIGADPEITPRARLTSTPFSALAGRMHGDLITESGLVKMKTPAGKEAIVLETGGDMQRPVLTLFDPQPEPPGKQFELKANAGTSASMSFFDQAGQVMGVEPTPWGGGISLKLFDPQPEPPGKLFELNSSSGSGASMSFFDQAGQVMGVEPSPFGGGFGLTFFDPQPEPPGKLFEITTSFGAKKAPNAGNSTTLRMLRPSALGGESEMVKLTADTSEAQLRMGPGAPHGSTASFIDLTSNRLQSKLDIVGLTTTITLSSGLGGSRIGIGTASPTQALHVQGNICYTGTIGACSDLKFKKDIRPISGALDAVSHLNGVRYSWKREEFPERQFGSERQVGLIAQEVKDILPEAVTLQSDGYYTIDYSRLTPLLLEAIKELKKQNEELTKRLDALEEK